MLNGQVGQATPRVDDSGADDAVCRAGIHTGCASSTSIGCGFGQVFWQGDVEEQLGDKAKGTQLGVNQHAVFADPAQVGALREVAFEERGGVDRRPRVDCCAGLLGEPLAERFELVAQVVVVVIAMRVSCDAQATVSVVRGEVVVLQDHNDGLCAWLQNLWVDAQIVVSIKVMHFAVTIFCQPLCIQMSTL